MISRTNGLEVGGADRPAGSVLPKRASGRAAAFGYWLLVIGLLLLVLAVGLLAAYASGWASILD